MKNKIAGWWLCLVTKFNKLSSAKQFALYTVLLFIPGLVAIVINDTSISIMIVVYLLCVYTFFAVGFRMVGNENATKD